MERVKRALFLLVLSACGSRFSEAPAQDASVHIVDASVPIVDASAPIVDAPPPPDCSFVETVVTTTGAPSEMTIYGSTLYWTVGSNLLEAPTSGGEATTIASGIAIGAYDNLCNLAVNETTVAWAYENVNVLPLPGGPMIVIPGQMNGLNEPDTSCSVALSPTRVYWVDTSTVRSALLDGGSPVTLFSTDAGFVMPLVTVDDSNVYWQNDVRVFKTPLGGGDASFVVEIPLFEGGTATHLLSDNTDLYWTEELGCQYVGNQSICPPWKGALMKAPIDGGVTTTIVTQQVALESSSVALDDAYVYLSGLADASARRSRADAGFSHGALDSIIVRRRYVGLPKRRSDAVTRQCVDRRVRRSAVRHIGLTG